MQPVPVRFSLMGLLLFVVGWQKDVIGVYYYFGLQIRAEPTWGKKKEKWISADES